MEKRHIDQIINDSIDAKERVIAEYVLQQREEEYVKKPSTVELIQEPDQIIEQTAPLEKEDYPRLKRVGKNSFRVLDVTENFQYLLTRKKIGLKYNMMNRRVETSWPGQTIASEDHDNVLFTMFDNLCQLNAFNSVKWRLHGHIKKLAIDNAYHPIRDAILNKPWDKKSRLLDFIRTLPVSKNDQETIDLFIKTWMTSAIAAAFSENGFSAQGVLVLQGDQGVGKSTWVKNLAPFVKNSISEGISLNPKIKDDLLLVSKFWIVELGELDGTFRKSDMAILKSYITRSQDNVRAPYALYEDNLPRRTVFAATVNESDFLQDTTGNRRWWTVAITGKIELNHGLDMQQVWAEVYHEWKNNGALSYIPHEKQQLIEKINEEHITNDPIFDMLNENYDWEIERIRRMTTLDIAEELGLKNITKRESNQISNAMRKLSGMKKPLKCNGARYWLMPEKMSF